MRQRLDLGQAEEAAGALDGMGRPEYLIYQLSVDICSAFFNRQQISLNGREVFSRFVNKGTQQFVNP